MTGLAAAFSTSSPWAGVALFTTNGESLWTAGDLAPHSASAALPALLSEVLGSAGAKIDDIELFGADLGPGSFTGVRVGIVFAKVLAYGRRAKVFGATSFDLIDASGPAFVPSRRGEVLIRIPGEEPYRAPEPPPGAMGYAFGEEGDFPDPGCFFGLTGALDLFEPELLLPSYFAEPAISTPKRPYAERRG
ncbi:MAG TPA: tRNA (adenosine(37)-N6)-threonylcarbamoyltransferase complex dimerization subunit type 1 TsaB [Fimbriimonadaceae bacterium]|nr:tRNA (adenosine(37)-N6)-threonylcarbamoyltransferase complex dimerization subunit type 1 TsaB [Fimbriimonadaceae bacterium]